MDFLEQTLNWCSTTPRSVRMDYIKLILETLTDEERIQVKNFASKTKKKSYRRIRREEVVSSIPADIIPPATASVPVLQTASEPVALEEASPKNNWFDEWTKDDMVSIDIEMVTPKNKEGKKKFTQKAATIAICDYEGRPIKNYMVYHAPGSYLVNKYTKAINGFREDSLKNGRPLDEIIKDIIKQIDQKLVIFCNAYSDLKSINLSASQLDIFDIQQYWKETIINDAGVEIEQPIGLKHIYYHYFKEKLQTGVHNPMIDAQATMRIFKEIYMQLPNPERFPSNPPFSEFPRIPN